MAEMIIGKGQWVISYNDPFPVLTDQSTCLGCSLVLLMRSVRITDHMLKSNYAPIVFYFIPSVTVIPREVYKIF